MMSLWKSNETLGETEVLAACRHSRVESLAQLFVTLVLG